MPANGDAARRDVRTGRIERCLASGMGRRRCLLPIGVFLQIVDWTVMRGSYGVRIVFDGWIHVYVDVDAKNRPIGNLSQWDDSLSDLEAAFRS